MNRFVKLLALLLALTMILSFAVSCGEGEKPDTPDTPDDGENENPDEGGDEPEKLEDPGYQITDTFFPQYNRAEYEYQDMKKKASDWFYKNLEDGTLFSVKVGDDAYDAIKGRLEKEINKGTDADGNETVNAVFTDNTAKIKYTLDAILYKDNPTVDYVITAENIGTETSAKLTEFYAVDSKIEMPSDKGYALHTTRGSLAAKDDFETVEKTISKGNTWTTFYPGVQYMDKTGAAYNESSNSANIRTGRSSDGAWPYFDIIGKDCGFIMAIGWSGQWEAAFANETVGIISLKARQQNLNTVLFAGEKIRSPRIVLTFFDGDYEYGHNVFRDLIVAHYTPENSDTDKFVSPICVNFWGGNTENFINSITNLYAEQGVTYDAAWLDAGWYGDYKNKGDGVQVANGSGNESWSTELGWYTVNKNLFPAGTFNNITDNFHAKGHKFLLWFMIEDACGSLGNKLVLGKDSYYDTVLSSPDSVQRIVLKLSDDAVLEKVLNLFREKLDKEGMDWIRCDFWERPYKAWTDYDIIESKTVDQRYEDYRQGITENKYICNLYRLWDTLYEEYPDFMLDNCASGGRRLDIEMIRRGVPLWRTDYETSDVEAMQAQTQWLSDWLVFSATGVVSPTQSSYPYRSLYSSSQSLRSASISIDNVTRMKSIVEELKEIRPYWYGSFYKLMEPDSGKDTWNAYMLYREDWQKGVAVIIRRQLSALDTTKIKFKGLRADQKYLVHNYDAVDNSQDFTMTGEDLMEKGVNISVSVQNIAVYTITLVNE